MTTVFVALAVTAVAAAGGAAAWAALAARRSRDRIAPGRSRILFPIVGRALSRPALDAALRIARAQDATLVACYLAPVPLHLPLDAALARECELALPLLEAVEQAATAAGVASDTRIERGRTYRHALLELIAHERYDQMVVAAAPEGAPGFSAADVAWLLDRAPGEIIVLRPGDEAPARRGVRAARGHDYGGRPATRLPAAWARRRAAGRVAA
jgi:universal stress protein family protein